MFNVAYHFDDQLHNGAVKAPSSTGRCHRKVTITPRTMVRSEPSSALSEDEAGSSQEKSGSSQDQSCLPLSDQNRLLDSVDTSTLPLNPELKEDGPSLFSFKPQMRADYSQGNASKAQFDDDTAFKYPKPFETLIAFLERRWRTIDLNVDADEDPEPEDDEDPESEDDEERESEEDYDRKGLINSKRTRYQHFLLSLCLCDMQKALN